MKFINVKTKNEIKELAALASKIWHEYWPCILTNEQINYMVEKYQSINAISNQLKNENYIYHIVKIKKPIGYFGVSTKSNYLFLSKFYLIKEARNNGFGKVIFKEIIKIAKENNKKSIKLTVNKNNKNTIEAYKKWGFTIIDSVVTDIGNGFVMDDYIMEYKLQEN